ncbi:MAG: hypothetical protein WBA89_23175 [Microcoleus sp.]|uniref:hypothetical protein n=1 Tax=Microcoleus sp. TaxID=44472 RepID=UPI003C753090
MCGQFWQRCDESSSIARVSAIEFLWNCRETALHIISPVATDRQLNFLMFRPLCAVGNNLRSQIFQQPGYKKQPVSELFSKLAPSGSSVMIEFGVSDILHLLRSSFRASAVGLPTKELSCGTDQKACECDNAVQELRYW